MTDKIELVSKQRRIGLVVMACSFMLVQSVSITIDRDSSFIWIAAYMINLGSIFIGYAGLSMVFKPGRYTSISIESALEDELVNSYRNAAFKYGFYAVIIVSALLSLITPFWHLPGEFIARTILTVGVVTPMFVFSYIDRIDA